MSRGYVRHTATEADAGCCVSKEGNQSTQRCLILTHVHFNTHEEAANQSFLHHGVEYYDVRSALKQDCQVQPSEVSKPVVDAFMTDEECIASNLLNGPVAMCCTFEYASLGSRVIAFVL
jgi:hypothetical protein